MEKKPTIVSLGEVLWDVFPEGPRFGGAPANVACHAAAMGADAAMVSAVGDDALGAEAIDTLTQRRVDVTCVSQLTEYATGTVQVELNGSGEPQFTIDENVAWDHLVWSDAAESLAQRADAVCFGSLGQRGEESRNVIRQFLQAVSPSSLRILDVNLRPPFVDEAIIRESLELANALKLSDEELDRVAAACGIRGDETEVLDALIRQFDLRLVALTRGDEGSTLIQDAQRSDAKGVSVIVHDTVGAGDAFTAALLLGYLTKKPLDTINRHAGEVAAYVCSQSGATPQLPGHLLRFPT